MNNKETAYLFFNEYEKIHSKDSPLVYKVEALQDRLNRLFIELSKDDHIHFTTMLARIDNVCHNHKLSDANRWHIHQFKHFAQKAATKKIIPTEAQYIQAVKTVFYTTAALCKTPIPEHIQAILPNEETAYPNMDLHKQDKVDYLRVQLLSIDSEKELLNCRSASIEHSFQVKYNEPAFNSQFNKTISVLINVFKGKATLHLLEVAQREGIYYPKGIVIEPDYLIDVSSISESFQHFGASPYIYLVSKFMPFDNSVPLMLGNVANFFLDELMHDSDAPFKETFVKTFGTNPLGFAAFEDREIKQIYEKSQKHFVNLRSVIKQKLPNLGIQLKDCYLEPSFYSQKYGIQGRLDVWHQAHDSDNATIIELKSGSPFAPNKHGLSSSHYTQTLLYDMLVQSVYGAKVHPSTYVLYSKLDIDHLKYAPPNKIQQDEAINIRNQIIGLEKILQDLDLVDLTQPNLLDRLGTNTIREAKGFLQQNLANFAKAIQAASPLERLYFMSFVSFTAREHQLAKTGDSAIESTNGLANLWLKEHIEKKDSFDILGYLQIEENQMNAATPMVRFRRTAQTHELANFRQGDIIILYPILETDDNALCNQIFKGSIIEIDGQFVSIQLRYKQSNDYLFKQNYYWHIERDMMDSGFANQYRALFTFLTSRQKFKDLFLAQIAPEQQAVTPLTFANPHLSGEQKRILQKALAAKDYFLLIGPPGTGKTKFMLAEMVRHLYTNTDQQILLMAYTNRAVDEICEAIHEFAAGNYLRIGSRHSTEDTYLDHLFSEHTANVATRKELMHIIENTRIFVSTVASISSKQTFLNLKKFNTAIIDEASQILEPMLIGMLPFFSRYILIGDHKQLPAVVVQSKQKSAVKEQQLHEIGLINRRNSLFERLFHQAKSKGWDWAYDMLRHQGRMHQNISEFPSTYFYDGDLELLPEEVDGAAWQKAVLNYQLPINANDLEQLLATRRVIYLNSEINYTQNKKTNPSEALTIGQVMAAFKRIYEASDKTFEPSSVGVITPFRAQIAQIKHTLEEMEMGFEQCTIDTVERYQGGAREIIIISLCMNTPFQMESIISLSDDEKVDRKLNVALTRARQHLVVIGNRELLNLDARYRQLLEWIDQRKP